MGVSRLKTKAEQQEQNKQPQVKLSRDWRDRLRADATALAEDPSTFPSTHGRGSQLPEAVGGPNTSGLQEHLHSCAHPPLPDT